jgi:PST family polysaccharide transporter
MSLRQRALQGVVWSVIQKWGREAISFVVLVTLSRLLAPEAFGLVAMALVFTAFVQIFLDQGFSAAIVQRADIEPEHLNTAFWISVSSGVVLTAGTVAASGLIGAFFDQPRLGPVVKVLSLGFILTALSSTQMAILQRQLAFKSLALRSITANMVGGVVGVSFAFAGFGVWSLVAQKLAGNLAGVIVLWRASDWRPGFKLSTKHYKELFTFGVSVVGNNILKVFVRRSNDFLIGYFLGATLLGYYTVGYKLLLVLLRLVTGIINSVAFPTFSRLQHNRERMRSAFYKVTQYTSLLAFPVFLGLAVLAPDLIPAIFGEKWAPSVPVLQVLAFIGILESVQAFNGSIMRASGKPSWQFGIMLLTSIGSVIGFFIAVRWGIVAVAASFVIVGYLFAPVSYAAVRRLIQIDFRTYARQFVPPLTASLIMLMVIVGLKDVLGDHGWNSYLLISLYVAVGGLVYLLVIGLTARSLLNQMLELVGLAFPNWRYKRT